MLHEAQRHPEQHRSLCVRVFGFSEYFVSLSPAAQDELIARTRL
jgi:formate C-acetyltransferase